METSEQRVEEYMHMRLAAGQMNGRPELRERNYLIRLGRISPAAGQIGRVVSVEETDDTLTYEIDPEEF